MNSSQAESGDYNSAAWYGLFTGKTEDLDDASASKSLQMAQNNTAALHTLGCVYAAEGKSRDAREVLLQAMEILNLEEPDPNYWYGFGRIAELYGESASAPEDYAKLTKPTKVERDSWAVVPVGAATPDRHGERHRLEGRLNRVVPLDARESR